MSAVISPGRVRRIKVTILGTEDGRVKLVNHTDGNTVKRYWPCDDESISSFSPGAAALDLLEMRSGDRRVRKVKR